MSQQSEKQVLALSPYHPNFKKYLDEQIADVVLKLIEKNHIVLFSCEGHQNFKPRYITMAFAQSDERSQFRKRISSFFSKNEIQMVDLTTLTSEIIDEVSYTYGTVENEVRQINALYFKNNFTYCFLRITIGKPFDIKNMRRIRFYYDLAYNMFFRDRITKKMSRLLTHNLV